MSAPRKPQGWADLRRVAQTLRERAQAVAAAEAEAATERARAASHVSEAELFARSVGHVAPLTRGERVLHAPPPPEPEPRQRQADEAAALQEAMSDEVDTASLLLTDDGLSFRRPSVAPEVLERLRGGHWSVAAELDLHGLRRDAARAALAAFLRQCQQRGARCVRIVHGKGHGSPGGVPVLKDKVPRWLAQQAPVLAFAQASAPQGGAGALVVLLNSPSGTASGR